MLPDFNRLKIFFYIFKHLSISIAAEKANITPSAVSQQLKKLEAELGMKLFSRPHKRMVPTTAGTEMFETLKPFIASLEVTVANLKRARDVPSGLVKIGAPVEFGQVVMPQLIASYREIYPEVTFFLKIGRTSELLPLVRDGQLDFAFMDTFPTKEQQSVEWDGLSLKPAFEEVVVLACSRNYEEKFLKLNYSFVNLIKQRFIAQQPDARAIKNWFYHNYKKSCHELNTVLTVASHRGVVNGIKSDIGLGIIVSQLAREDISAGDIVVIQTGRNNPVNKVTLVQLLDKVPSLTEKSFQAHILKGLQKENSAQISEIL